MLSAPEVTLRIARALEREELGCILDVACGPGVLTPLLSGRARQVVGLDLTRATLDLARERSSAATNAAFVQGLAEQTPFRTHHFDAAVLRLALHHFENPPRVLTEVHRSVRRGGRLVVLDVTTSSDPEIAGLHNAIERLRDPSHTALLPPDALREQLEAAGFGLLSEETWESTRDFAEWARIISEPKRMASLEVVMRHLARAGVETGMDLREEDSALRFTYRWALLVAEAL